MDENEEFEFRARAEAEANQAAPSIAPETKSSVLQKAGEMAKSGGMKVLRSLDWLSHLGQPQAAKDLVQRIATDSTLAPKDPDQVANVPSLLESFGQMTPGMTAPGIPRGMDMRPALSSAVDMATSPSTYLSVGLSGAAKIPWVAAALKSAGKLPEAAATGIASKLTHIPSEALSAASTPAGRASLAMATESAPAQVKKLVGVASNARTYMPEAGRVTEALAKAPEIDIGPTLKAFDEAMPKALGPMDAATPGILGLRNKIQAYKAAVQGRLPSAAEIADMDFAGNLDEAKAAIADPESKWGILSDLARKAAAQVERSQGKAYSATNRVNETWNEFKDAPERVIRHEGFPQQGYMQNKDLPRLLQANKLAEKVAKEAYANASAKAATGEITARDAAKAKAELDRATQNLHVADAANEFSQGNPLDDVSRAMVDRHGLSGGALTDALKKGRQFVADNSFTPAPVSSKMSATDFKRLREALDRDIDFNAPDYKSLKGALKVPRDQMKQALIETLGPEYADDMEKWSGKIDAFNELNSRLGKLPSHRLNRAETLLNGHEKIGNADLIATIDQITGGKFAEGAKLKKVAAEFGPTGKPAWSPVASPFTMLSEAAAGAGLGHYSGHPFLAALASGTAMAGSSPGIATKLAIPASRIPPYLLRAMAQRSPALSAIGSLPEDQ